MEFFFYQFYYSGYLKYLNPNPNKINLNMWNIILNKIYSFLFSCFSLNSGFRKLVSFVLNVVFFFLFGNNCRFIKNHKSTTKNIKIPFTQIYLLLTFYPLYSITFSPTCVKFVCRCVSLYVHVYMYVCKCITHTVCFCESFEDKLQTSLPFIPKYFNVYFL